MLENDILVSLLLAAVVAADHDDAIAVAVQDTTGKAVHGPRGESAHELANPTIAHFLYPSAENDSLAREQERRE